MTAARPLVTVIIPALDEERDLAACLTKVAAQTYGADRIEVVVVDGCSKDATVAVAARALAAGGFASSVVLTNPARLTSSSLNVGLAAAQGEYVVRVDARSRITPGHVARAVDVLASRPEVGVVGGAQRAVARDHRVLSTGIARALNNRWTTGMSRYRRSARPGPADTVWMGSFRTADLHRLGGWDADVFVNEDFVLNEAYRASGATVWFDPALTATYLPRPDLTALARQYFRFGRSKAAVWSTGHRPRPRQVALLAVPPLGVAAATAIGRRHGWVTVAAATAATAVVVDAIGGDR
ncbi:MAG: glycosyl transferase family 2, partial [Acidimicrobiales bacterium]|nr:glycosyl transferase family 2 [Acidimicrobiales bacterium]